MRNIMKRKQIAFASLTEIRQGLAIEAERLADLGMKGGGPRSRVAAPAHLLNWICCWFLELTTDQREGIARDGRAIFDAHAASDVPVPFGRSVPAGDGGSLRQAAIKLGPPLVEVNHVDPQGQDQPAQERRTPKRRP